LTGVFDGQAVSLLSPGTFNFNDNSFKSPAPYVTANGFAFATANSKWVNVFNLSGVPQEAVAPAGTSFSASSTPLASFTAAPSAVPWEPSDVAVIAGVALFGFQRLRRKRQAA
jgi:hypothetical protein